MANSSLAQWTPVGGQNGGNAALINAIDSDKLPWAFCPELTFEHTVKWTDLQSASVVQSATLLVGGTIVQGDHAVAFIDARTGVTIGTVSTPVHHDRLTIAGTASDGNYDAIFSGVPGTPRARVTRSTTPSSNDNIVTAMAAAINDLVPTTLAGYVASASAATNVVSIVYEAGIVAQAITTAESTATGTITATTASTASTVAAALEALIETARATALADYVEDESVDTATITVDFVDGEQVTMTPTFPGTSTATIAITNVATIPMGRTGDWFPTNVWVNGGIANVVTAFAGDTPTITATMGDAGAVDGLITSTSIATAAVIETISAAEHAEHMEPAFEPIATITSNRVFSSLTAGEVSFMVRYSPPPTI